MNEQRMYTISLSYLTKRDARIAGGKGASLGEMMRAGIPVPPGFVILLSAFEHFLSQRGLKQKIDSLLTSLDYKKQGEIERVSKKIRAMILDTEVPDDISPEVVGLYTSLVSEQKLKYVAVRSSATTEDSSAASWAGELESYLNVEKKDLFDSIKNCWSSLFTPRAIFYRFEKKMHNKPVSVAVVVQRMIQSEVSGICFTVHPVTKEKSAMVIEAGYGLGEAIVGGRITPDSYVVKKVRVSKKSIITKHVSEQKLMIVRGADGNTQEVIVPRGKQRSQKLPDRFISKLALLCAEIERHYGCPQDIEWALEKNKLYIVQSRPITTL